MAAVASVQLETSVDRVDRIDHANFDMQEDDMDAEGEDDVEIYHSSVNTPLVEGAGEDEQSESDESDKNSEANDEADGEEDEEDFVGAVKIPNGRTGDSDEDEVDDDDDGSEAHDGGSGEEDDDSDKSSDSAESVAVEEWEGASEGAETAEAEVANRNNCV
jgi:histone acetyltransferase SAS3